MYEKQTRFNKAFAQIREYGGQRSVREKNVSDWIGLPALDDIPRDKTVLIAGPTASGKSDLALRIAETGGGVIVNADALQVFNGWRVLTARPSPEDEARARHVLYGHVAYDAPYSAGHWLRDVSGFTNGPDRAIIVGGTGLYFTALTQGLAEIPATPPEIRNRGDQKSLQEMIEALDEQTRSRIDLNNRARVQRAWEVLEHTGQNISKWQDQTPPPLISTSDTIAIVMRPEKEWLNERITRRFDLMLQDGALEEAREMLPYWDPKFLSSKAIGAPELIAHLKGEISLDEARERAIVASRQYAKRQRTWFRSRMKDWIEVSR